MGLAQSVEEQSSPCSLCGFAFPICSSNRIFQEEMFQIRTFRPANVAFGGGGGSGGSGGWRGGQKSSFLFMGKHNGIKSKDVENHPQRFSLVGH